MNGLSFFNNQRFGAILILCLLVCGTIWAVPPGGDITGVVVESRKDEDNTHALLIEVQGDRDAEADEVRIKIPKTLVDKVSTGLLPEGWTLTPGKGLIAMSGAGVKLPLFIRLDLGQETPPAKTDVTVLNDGKKAFTKKGILIKRLPPVKLSSDFSNILRFPPLVSPGDLLWFKPLDPAKTPVGGTWKVDEKEAEYVEEKEYYSLSLGYDLKLDAKLTLSYTDAYGYDLYSGGLKDIQIVAPLPEGERPYINAVSPMVFVGDLICICGYFPGEATRSGILLDGKSIGGPVSASSHLLVFRLPGEIQPGRHVISGSPGAGFAGLQTKEFEVIRVSGSIDRNKLLRGESTPLRMRIEGTEKVLTVTLTNHTPQIISLEGGNEQDIPTSGGAENTFEKMVQGISKGDFRLNYNLNLSFCPCTEQETQQDSGEEEVFENSFDETFDSFRDARDLANESANHKYDDLELAKLKAREALEEFTRTREHLQEGIDNGDIGPNTAESFRRFISEYETQVRKILETPQEETELPVSHVPEPIHSRPEDMPRAVVTDGWLAPIQAVWQDDDVFKDFSGKQLTNTGPGQWNAELKMVVGKSTVIAGIRDDNWNRIKIMGTANGTRLTKVKFRFKLIQGSNEKIVYTERKANNYVALDGVAGEDRPFACSIMAGEGLPKYGSFTIDSAGSYTIEAELLREDGSETGLKITVSGEATQTYGPDVKLVPVILSSGNPAAWGGSLAHIVQQLATACQEGIPRFFPIAPGGMTVTAEPTLNLRHLEPGVGSKLKSLLPFTDTVEEIRADTLSAAMAQRFGTGSAMTNGPKVVVMLSDHDFDLTRRGGGAQAYCASTKFMVARHDTNFESIAHELIHSMPYLWSKDQMQSLFGINYHNAADGKYGEGMDVRSWGGLRKKDEHSIMGSAYIGKWINQGTYWHLLNEFRSKPDPELLLVRGYIARDGSQRTGIFEPFYQIMGTADLEALTAGTTANQWLVAVKDKNGKVLARYPIHAQWMVPDLEVERKILSFTYRIPWSANIHRLELLAPSGVVDKRNISANAPNVKITSPSANTTVKPQAGKDGRFIRVTWTASDPDNDQLYYLLFYSPDNGNKWRLIQMDTQQTSAELPVPGNPKKIRVRIVASDGFRSAEHEIALNVNLK